MIGQHVAVAIVGGGPSGLTAAAALAEQIDGEVLVIEREAEAGGIPRHSDHLGYGIRDLKRFISGPSYARRLTASATDAGVTLETEALVLDWSTRHGCGLLKVDLAEPTALGGKRGWKSALPILQWSVTR